MTRSKLWLPLVAVLGLALGAGCVVRVPNRPYRRYITVLQARNIALAYARNNGYPVVRVLEAVRAGPDRYRVVLRENRPPFHMRTIRVWVAAEGGGILDADFGPRHRGLYDAHPAHPAYPAAHPAAHPAYPAAHPAAHPAARPAYDPHPVARPAPAHGAPPPATAHRVPVTHPARLPAAAERKNIAHPAQVRPMPGRPAAHGAVHARSVKKKKDDKDKDKKKHVVHPGVPIHR